MSNKRASTQSSFGIENAQLQRLFEPDNVRDHDSIKIINKDYQGIDNVMKMLRTDAQRGILGTPQDIQERQASFGANLPPQRESSSLFEMILECFEDFMLQILCVAALVSTVIGIIDEGWASGWMEGAAIMVAIILIVSVTAGNNYAKEKQFQKLNAKREEMSVHVTRNDKIVYIDVKQLVVGDILHIQIGDLLPVDGILVEGSEIYMDESSVTGESDLIPKVSIFHMTQANLKQQPFMISGSKVMDGSGKMLICSVGVHTQLGQLRERLQEEQPPTPLQLKLETIAEQIGEVGTIFAGLTLLAMIVNLGIDIYLGHHCFTCIETVSYIIKAFMTSITIIVVAVPEGLPLAVSIALAYSVNKMKDENNLVKQLQSCEIMGGATTICSDKTGTLTQNIMSVQRLYIDNFNYKPPHITAEYIPPQLAQLFSECACLNSSANPTKNSLGKFEQIGNKTECALLELADTLGYNYVKVRQQNQIIRTIPFSSSRKKMTVLIRLPNNRIRIYVKGASETILEKCANQIIKSEPFFKPIEDVSKIKQQIILKYSNEAFRTLALAYKDIDYNPNYEQLTENVLESDLTLIAITGIKDPLRNEIPEAVRKCKSAGITVRMVTGDNVNTAVAIAKEAGIISESTKTNTFQNQSANTGGFEVMEGKKFREIVGGIVYENPQGKSVAEKGASRVQNLEMFKAIARELKVLARSTPDDKYTLVTGLIQIGHVVAVTGDGTNDAPALKKADVGFAMGIAGTEVSKDAADIILLDDNFASIVTACKWGRNIYDSIRKFIQFQLTANIVALFMSFTGAVILKKSPLNSIEMLWVNIIIDTFASLALATEPPNDKLLERKPYARDESIITPNMWRNIFGQSLYQIIMLTLLLFKGPEWFNVPNSFKMEKYDPVEAQHFTIFFQAFVFMQVFNEFNARKLEKSDINIFAGLFNNPLFWVVIIITFIVQFLLVDLGGKYVGVTPLTWEQNLICLGIGAGSLVVGVVIKIFPNFLFNKIKLFREEEMDQAKLDRSFTSMMRRKSSVRLGTHLSGKGNSREFSHQA
ncbi:hypothetical protein ABPG74_015749 [Tetrahymena malaccensis]